MEHSVFELSTRHSHTLGFNNAYLSLSRLEAINNRGNGAFVVHVREKDQFFVDEVAVRYHLCVFSIQIVLSQAELLAAFALVHEFHQPVLALIGIALSEGERERGIVFHPCVAKLDAMPSHVGEIFFGFFAGASTQTWRSKERAKIEE